MFKNRKIQIGLVKPSTDEESTDYADKMTIASVCVDSAIKKVAFGVAFYVLADTLRKVTVTVVEKKMK